MAIIRVQGKRRIASFHLLEELLQDLTDLKFHSGESKSDLVNKALRLLFSTRARYIKPSSIAAERLLARYGSVEA